MKKKRAYTGDELRAIAEGVDHANSGCERIAELAYRAVQADKARHSLQQAEPEWLPIETAPKGLPGEDAGSREQSEWFVGRISSDFHSDNDPPFVVIRRRASPHEDGFVCHGDAYYCSGYFDAWKPLTTSPALPAGQWVKTEERIPTRADADAGARVWVLDEYFGVVQRFYDDVPASMAHIYSHWMPTGLVKPEPPTERD